MARSDTAAIVKQLQATDAFADCAKEDLEDLASHADHTSVPAHWSLIHQDTPADACYVLLDGEATVSIKGKKVATMEPGAVIGELGLVGHKLRSATVTSTASLDLLHLEAADFKAILERRPKLKEIFLARTSAAAEAASKA